jgi:putative salt-induced outer membrane protein YdiY
MRCIAGVTTTHGAAALTSKYNAPVRRTAWSTWDNTSTRATAADPNRREYRAPAKARADDRA